MVFKAKAIIQGIVKDHRSLLAEVEAWLERNMGQSAVSKFTDDTRTLTVIAGKGVTELDQKKHRLRQAIQRSCGNLQYMINNASFADEEILPRKWVFFRDVEPFEFKV